MSDVEIHSTSGCENAVDGCKQTELVGVEAVDKCLRLIMAQASYPARFGDADVIHDGFGLDFANAR